MWRRPQTVPPDGTWQMASNVATPTGSPRPMPDADGSQCDDGRGWFPPDGTWQMASNVTTPTGSPRPMPDADGSQCGDAHRQPRRRPAGRWCPMWRRSQTFRAGCRMGANVMMVPRPQPFRILPRRRPRADFPSPGAVGTNANLAAGRHTRHIGCRAAGTAGTCCIAVGRGSMVAGRYDRPGLIGGRSAAVGLPIWYDSWTTFRSSRVGFGR